MSNPQAIENATTSSAAMRAVPALDAALNSHGISDAQIDAVVEINNAKALSLRALNNEGDAANIASSVKYFVDLVKAPHGGAPLSETKDDSSKKKPMSAGATLALAITGGVVVGGLVVLYMRTSGAR